MSLPLDKEIRPYSLENAQSDGWISVKDRLPESHMFVLIYLKHGLIDVSYYSDILHTWGDIDANLNGEYSTNQISHWAYVPE